MSDKVKVALIFGTVAAVVGGGGFYFFKVHQPQQQLDDARAEIAAWEARWTQTRTCLLGEKPASAKISEALAIREMSPDPWERKTCTSLVSQLNRGEADDTGIPAIEAAWTELDKAAGKVAMSFITHVDPDGEQPGNKYKPDPLPEALDAFEGAHAALRQAAKLGPPAKLETAAPLRAATMIALEHEGKPVVALSQRRVTHRAGLLGFATAVSGEVQIQFVTGTEPKIAAVEGGTLRATPDLGWGARGTDEGVEVGAIDAGGELVEPTKLPLPGAVEVFAAVGTLDDGAVVFGAGDKLAIARGKAGKFTAGKPLDMWRVVFATDPASGQTVIVYTTPKQELFTLTLAPGQLDATPVPLARQGFPSKLCLDGDSAWLEVSADDETRLLDLKAGQATEHETDGHSLVSCTVDGALLTKSTYDGPTAYRHCMDKCNDFSLDKGRALVVLSHGWAGFHARGNVLAVKRTARTDYFATTGSFRPVLSMTDGKQIDVIGYTIDGISIARVPAN